MKMPTPTGEYTALSAGTHAAVCVQVLGFGTQTDTYEGKETSRYKVWLGFEVSSDEETMADGRPFWIGKEFTFSSSPRATLRKFLESWRGAAFSDDDLKGDNAFDLKCLLGQGALLNVVHNANGRAVLNGCMKLPKGMAAPESERSQYLDLDDFDHEVFDQLQDWMKERIAASPEGSAALGTNEDTPF